MAAFTDAGVNTLLGWDASTSAPRIEVLTSTDDNTSVSLYIRGGLYGNRIIKSGWYDTHIAHDNATVLAEILAKFGA